MKSLIIVLCICLAMSIDVDDKTPLTEEFLQGAANQEVTCHKKTDSDNRCLVGSFMSSLEVYYCNKDIYCTTEESGEGECKPIRKFYGKTCENNDECLTGLCTDNVCVYKEDGAPCNNNRECGLKSYCSNSVCKAYVGADGTCDDETNLCSPQYLCKEGTCKLKGTASEGQTVTNPDECASFYVSIKTGTCNEVCDAPNQLACIAPNCKKEMYKKIEWDSVKLSDYSGDNMGSEKMLYGYWDFFKTMMPELDFNCLTPVLNQGVAVQVADGKKPTFMGMTMEATLPDETIQKLLKEGEIGYDSSSSFLSKSFVVLLLALIILF